MLQFRDTLLIKIYAIPALAAFIETRALPVETGTWNFNAIFVRVVPISVLRPQFRPENPARHRFAPTPHAV